MNENHDPANGQFSSGGGSAGQPRQHPDAAANAHDVHASMAGAGLPDSSNHFPAGGHSKH
jgi:hypothetical protein